MRLSHWPLAIAVALPGPLAAAQTPMTCSYFNLKTDQLTTEDEPCTLEEVDDRTIVRTGNVTVVIEDFRPGEMARQGQWARVRLNGKPATSYELYRQSWVYATDDLTEFLDMRDRGAPQYPR